MPSKLDLNLFGENWKSRIYSAAKSVGSVPDFATASAITSVASMIGDHVRIRSPHHDSSFRVLVWCNVFGVTGLKKGPACNSLLSGNKPNSDHAAYFDTYGAFARKAQPWVADAYLSGSSAIFKSSPNQAADLDVFNRDLQERLFLFVPSYKKMPLETTGGDKLVRQHRYFDGFLKMISDLNSDRWEIRVRDDAWGVFYKNTPALKAADEDYKRNVYTRVVLSKLRMRIINGTFTPASFDSPLSWS